MVELAPVSIFGKLNHYDLYGGGSVKRWFRRIGICVLVFGVVVAFNSCGAVEGFTYNDAKDQFIAWLLTQEVEEHAIGQYLGQVSVGDVVSSITPIPLPDQEPEQDSGPLPERGWLFYVDEWPGSYYNHPGKIYVVSETGRVLFERNTQGWPVVNGDKPESTKRSFRDMISDNRMTIYNPNNIRVGLQLAEFPDLIPRFIRTGAVVVNGLIPSESLNTESSGIHVQMGKAMRDLLGTLNLVRSVTYPNNKPADVKAEIQYLVDSYSVNYIILYFNAHGGDKRMNIGGLSFSAIVLRNWLEEFSNVEFILIFDTCHAGIWADFFGGLIDRPANLHMVIASTGADQGAYPDWDEAEGETDYNAEEDTWVEFSSDFLLMMAHYTSDTFWPSVEALTNPAFDNNILKLFYLSFQAVKNEDLLLTARLNRQTPQIWYPE